MSHGLTDEEQKKLEDEQRKELIKKTKEGDKRRKKREDEQRKELIKKTKEGDKRRKKGTVFLKKETFLERMKKKLRSD